MTEGERGIKYFNSLNGSRRILLPSSAISASGNISASQARTTPPSRREALLARSLARGNYRRRAPFVRGRLDFATRENDRPRVPYLSFVIHHSFFFIHFL